MYALWNFGPEAAHTCSYGMRAVDMEFCQNIALSVMNMCISENYNTSYHKHRTKHSSMNPPFHIYIIPNVPTIVSCGFPV